MALNGGSYPWSGPNEHSGACVYGAFCTEDVNADVAVTVGDLLQILGAYCQVC